MENELKSSDLRIDNLINSKLLGTNHLVKGLIVRNEKTYLYTDLQESYSDFEDWQPIPITEQWLLDLGFVIKKGKFGNEYHFKNFILYTSKEQTICFVYDEYLKDITHIHQLQNLYFALTNEELTLKSQ